MNTVATCYIKMTAARYLKTSPYAMAI